MESLEKVEDYIIRWLNDYADKSNMKGFVVGISGGIDSALTSTLCAMTGKALLCLEMPIKQVGDQLIRSSKHIKWLEAKYRNVRSIRLNLDSVFDSFCSVLHEGRKLRVHIDVTHYSATIAKLMRCVPRCPRRER